MKTNSICLLSVLVSITLAVPMKGPSRKTRVHNKYIPKINTTICKAGFQICNETILYPTKSIERLVKKKKNLPLFSKVHLIEPADEVPIPKLRIESAPEPNNLCRTQTVTILPKAGYDYHSGEQRFIVNIKNYVQTVVYETCVDTDKTCMDIVNQIPFGFHTLCTQKYNIVRLVSLSREGKVEYGKFMVPSTCVCSYVKESTEVVT